MPDFTVSANVDTLLQQANFAGVRTVLGELLHAYNQSVAPTANEDSGDGFAAGSRWYRTNGEQYVCTVATVGAAVWSNTFNGNIITPGAGTLSMLFGSTLTVGVVATCDVSFWDDFSTIGPVHFIQGNNNSTIIIRSIGGTADVTLPATGTLASRITATATLNFPNTAAGNFNELNITLTGAIPGEVVMLGLSPDSVTDGGIFFAWVNVADTLIVRFVNTNLVTAIDPASGDFTATIIR